jgi:hypothetical protein
MTSHTPTPDGDEPNPLTPEEQAILEKLQQLAAAGVEEVDPVFLKLINQTIKWDFNDPESVERSLYFMARDPFHQREVKIINAEFAAADVAALQKPSESVPLTPQEQRLIKTLRLLQTLEPKCVDQTEEFVWTLVGKHLKWSYSDSASIERAVAFMALDPFLRREVEAISADFACTLMDGLEEY